MNPHLVFDRFTAVDGLKIERGWMIEQGLATQACADRYTPGAIGVALSHRELWQECAAGTEDYTIIEDDAVLVPNFNSLVTQYCGRNPGWDWIFWGANFDQRMVVEISPGIAAAEINYNFSGVQANINLIRGQALDPKIFRVHWAVGLVCYTIRPKTARYLLDTIFPLKDYFTWRDNYGIDNSIIEELANMYAGVSLPPLALTLNDRTTSTVQVGMHGAGVRYAHKEK